MVIFKMDKVIDCFLMVDTDKVRVSSCEDEVVFCNSSTDNNVYYLTTRGRYYQDFGDRGMVLSPNHIDISRDSDYEMVNKLTFHNIRTPLTYVSNALPLLINKLNGGKKYLLKTVDQARSIGQKIFTKEELYGILADGNRMSREEFNEKHIKDPGDAYNDDEKYILYQALGNKCGVYVQEIVDLESEYRILVFNDPKKKNFIVEKRSGYQIESKETRKHEVVQCSTIPEDVMNKLFDFVHKYNYPALAFDVYFTKDDNGEDSWGVFEYCVTYGVEYEGHYDKLIKYTTSGLLNMVTEFKKRRENYGNI